MQVWPPGQVSTGSVAKRVGTMATVLDRGGLWCFNGHTRPPGWPLLVRKQILVRFVGYRYRGGFGGSGGNRASLPSAVCRSEAVKGPTCSGARNSRFNHGNSAGVLELKNWWKDGEGRLWL